MLSRISLIDPGKVLVSSVKENLPLLNPVKTMAAPIN